MPEANETIHQPRLRGHLPHKPAVIYLLIDPRDDSVRYVGVTTKNLKQRYNEHASAARRGERSYAYAWFRQVLADGLRPEIKPIEDIAPGGDWISAERRWIKFYRDAGARLANLTDGGDGVWGYRRSPEQRAAMAVALTGRKFCAAARANISAARKLKGQPEALKRAIAERPPMLGRKHTEDAKRRMGETKKANGFVPWIKGKKRSQESLERQRIAKVEKPDRRPQFRTRAVIVNGVTYDSMNAAGRALGVKQRDINYWIRRGRAFYADGNNPVVKPPGRMGRPPKPRRYEQASLPF